MKKMQTKQNRKKGEEKRALPRIKHSTSCVLAQFYTVREDMSNLNKYFFKTLPVELPHAQARAVPETFSCLDKTAGYFFIVKTTQRKLHSGTGKNDQINH